MIKRLGLLTVLVGWLGVGVAAEPAGSSAVTALREELQTHYLGAPRGPGMAGNRQLESYVEQTFEASGFRSGKMEFWSPVFVPGPARLELPAGPELTIEAMHPSLMRPGNFAERKFTTRVVYLGKGTYRDLEAMNGVELTDTLALLDYDCGDNWLYLLRFGFKGFLFAGQADSHYYHSYTKVYNTEVACPRYYLAPEAGAQLKAAVQQAGKAGLAVTVGNEPSKWVPEKLKNLWVLIPGSDPLLGKETVVFTAPLDANCVVPGRAWGAQSVGNLKLLLDLLQEFRREPPKRSVLLVAVNAHTQHYKGERILAWFLQADAGAVASKRNEIARDMRLSRMYSRAFAKLKLAPFAGEEPFYDVGLDLLWKLDAQQQEQREAEAANEIENHERWLEQATKEREDLTAATADSLLGQALAPAWDAAERYDLPRAVGVDPVLDLSSFSDQDFISALQAVLGDYRDQQWGFRWWFSADESAKEFVRSLESKASELAARDTEFINALTKRLKPVFDDEKLFENWRYAVDKSSGDRVMIKKPLQDEASRNLNRLKLQLLDLSTAKVTPAIRERLAPQLTAMSETEREALLARLPEAKRETYARPYDEARREELLTALSGRERAKILEKLTPAKREDRLRKLYDDARQGLLIEVLYADERERELKRLGAAKPDYTKVLKLFNKIDIGIGSSRTRYRDIARSPAQLRLLTQYRDKAMELHRSRYQEKRDYLALDSANDSVKDALAGRTVRLVVCLGLDYQEPKFGFCSLDANVATTNWAAGFGRWSTEVAEAVTRQLGPDPNPFTDTLTGAGSNPEDHYFRDVRHAAENFHVFQGTAAFTLRNCFVGQGRRFTPDDTLAALDLEAVARQNQWLVPYFRALLGHESITSQAVSLGAITIDGYRQGWSTTLRTYTMDEFAASTTPNDPVPQSLVAIYPTVPANQPFLIDGEVLNCYTEISDNTGQVIVYAINNFSTLAPIVYKLDDSFTQVRFTIDKGRIQASQQNVSNLNQNPTKTFAMFPCREFPILDRVDPTKIATDPILEQQYWPNSASQKAEPQRYGTHGVGCLSVAASHQSRGPAAAYMLHKEGGMQSESLLLLTSARRAALNATGEDPEGSGFDSPDELGPDFFMVAAEDMERLNHFRKRKMRGVTDALLDDFLKAGNEDLQAMRQRRQNLDHTGFVQANYRALGNEVKAYEQLRRITGDMLSAIIFYMFLMLPFCFFFQKLVFKFVKIEHQLLAFVFLFISVYIMFRLIHPAFSVATHPEAILVAFVLGAVGAFVTWVMHSRFEGEMKLLFHAYTGMGGEVGYSTVSQTAMLIGVNNMKRRRIRTTLTTATIVLVTFAMLAFSSVSKKMNPTVIFQSADAAYTGFFYVWPGTREIDEDTLTVFHNMFDNRAQVFCRRAALPGKSLRTQQIYPWRLTFDNGSLLDIQGLVGLPPEDHGTIKDMLLAGRYFSSPDAAEVILTVSACEAVKITPQQIREGSVKLRFLGEELTLIGMVDDEQYRQWRDLAPNIPLLPRKEQPAQSGTMAALSADDASADDPTALSVDTNAIVVLPEGRAKLMGAKPLCISVKFPEDPQTGKVAVSLWQEMATLLTITRAKFFMASREAFKAGVDGKQTSQAGAYYVGSGYKTSLGGLSRLIIPLLIAGSIILNTMLGTVYERKSEIAVYNAIGLNPTHIFTFFLAEAFVYAVLGSVGGYVIGQGLAMIIKRFDLIPGININFSSLMVVYSIAFTILLVLLSTIYPAMVATKTAVPSGKRKWSLPDHDGQTMKVMFPFIYQPELATGVMYYLHEYFGRFSEKSMGNMIAASDRLAQDTDDQDRPRYTLVYAVALAPFDLGVTQQVTFVNEFHDEVQSYRVRMQIDRVSGQDTNWVTTNKPFLEELRKVLIRWRNLDPTEHRWYGLQGDAMFRGKPAPSDPKPQVGLNRSYVAKSSSSTSTPATEGAK